MNLLKTTATLFLIFQITFLYGQYKAIDFEISISPYFDDRALVAPPNTAFTIFGISQFGLGYSTQVGPKFVFSSKIAWGLAGEWYRSGQFSSSPNTLPNSTEFFEIKRRAHFIKLGLAASYWFKKTGIGPFAEGELLNITSLSAKSIEKYRMGNEEIQETTVDYKDELKSNVPSMRLGIGYNLKIKRVILFARLGLEMRLSTYFTTTDNYTLVNRSLGFGFRYLLTDLSQSEN